MLKHVVGNMENARYPRTQHIELGIVNLAYSIEQSNENEISSAEITDREVADDLPHSSMGQGQPLPSSLSSMTSQIDGEPPDKAGNEHKQVQSRDKWDNQMEFLLSCVSMSVGLGNVWRFPFTAYENGGGAFLIPYLIALFIFGRPMYFLEMCLGQFSSFGPVNIWEISPIFRGVGYASMMAACCTASFYCSIMAITVYYFFLSFSSTLPWSVEVCNNDTGSAASPNIPSICGARNEANLSFSELYYYSSVFPQMDNIDSGIGLPHWRLTICLLISWVVIYVFLMKGIKSAGKVSYFTAFFPYVVLFALLIRGVTLPGAIDGIYYFIKPDWTKLLSAKVWFAAVSQCFFSLNVGFGTIVFLSSHNRFRHNVFRDALVISVTDTLTSVLAGCAIFSLLGYLAKTMNTNIEDVTRGGPGLAFIAFPESIAHLEFFPQGFSVLFFLMLFTLGVGSAMMLAGQVLTIIRDIYPTSKKWQVALLVCTLGFLSGVVYITPGGQFILTLVNHNGVDFIIYITAMIEIIAISWVYGVNRFCDDIKFMLGREIQIYWKICWAFIMPVGLFTLLVYFFASYKSLLHEGTQFPTSAIACGWVLSGIILITLPICAIKAVRQSRGNTWFEKVQAALKPMPSWGPKCPNEREAWLLEMKELREIDKIKVSTDQFSNASTVPPTSTNGSN